MKKVVGILRDEETTNIPFVDALTGALRRCSSLMWPATQCSERLALHPASTSKNGTSVISSSLTGEHPGLPQSDTQALADEPGCCACARTDQ
jgi:hypothetical protein